MLRLIIISLMCVVLLGCDNGDNFAPVTDASGFDPVPQAGKHVVKHGETLYEIAWRYGMDYRSLAATNNMHSPYILYSGQVIYLRGRNTHAVVYHANRTRHVVVTAVKSREPDAVVSAWAWPAHGRIIGTFSSLNKGINIAGKADAPIYAAASGKVVYSGEGLRGYGKLIILKHNSTYLSAYAHNNAILVHEGEWVTKGQKIAKMGNSGADRVMLHFEIRQAGKPIDPTGFLLPAS